INTNASKNPHPIYLAEREILCIENCLIFASLFMIKQWILHDWNDDECLKILKRCKDAIKGRKGGKVIIIDMVMGNQKGDDESTETQLFLDILMIVLYASKERNEKEWSRLFSDAGFRGYKITPILGLRSIIEVYP